MVGQAYDNRCADRTVRYDPLGDILRFDIIGRMGPV
jgi:hypothetical protein